MDDFCFQDDRICQDVKKLVDYEAIYIYKHGHFLLLCIQNIFKVTIFF